MQAKVGVGVIAGLVLAAVPLLRAQRVQSGGQAVGVPHVAVRPAGPNLGGTPFPYRSAYAPPTGLVAPAASYTGITPGALRSPVNRYGSSYYNQYGSRRGFAPVYAGFYGVPYLPFADDSSYYSFPSYSEQAEGVSAQMSAQDNAQMQEAMAQQMDHMNQEIRRLNENQMQMGYQMQQAGPPPLAYPGPPPAVANAEPQPPQVPITLVMQNGATVSVNNYAVMNGVIWDFSKQPARKIALSTVNIAASQKATEDNGGDFPQLNASR